MTNALRPGLPTQQARGQPFASKPSNLQAERTNMVGGTKTLDWPLYLAALRLHGLSRWPTYLRILFAEGSSCR